MREVTRTTYDIFQNAKQNSIPGTIQLNDLSNDVDIITFNFILSARRILEFSKRMISLVSALLHDFQIMTMPNGNSSNRILLGRGCWQGVKGIIGCSMVQVFSLFLKFLSLYQDA